MGLNVLNILGIQNSKEEKIAKLLKVKASLEGTDDEKAEFNTDLDDAYRSGIHDAIWSVIDLVNADKL